MSTQLDTISEKPSDALLGYCPGYTPSREFLESAAQYIKSVIQNYHLAYTEALEDVVRSIYAYKVNAFKKDHRVFLHKTSLQRNEREPLSSPEVKLKDDIRRFILTGSIDQNKPVKKARYQDLEESCSTHKKDCNTNLHKTKMKYKELSDTITCIWFKKNEKLTQRNKAYYFGYDFKPKVHFEGHGQNLDDDNDDNINYDRSSMDSAMAARIHLNESHDNNDRYRTPQLSARLENKDQ